MSIGNRIMELRKDMGYTRNEFAEFIGIPSTTLRNYELGTREPGHPFLIQMAYIFNVSTDYLLCLTDDRSPIYCNNDLAIFDKNEIEVIKKFHALDQHGKELVELIIDKEYERRLDNNKRAIKTYPTKVVSDYGFLASAGNGQFVFDDIPFDTIEVPYDCKADFVVGVNGDSMEPTYYDRDKLLIRKQNSILPGCIGIFMIDGEAFVKELGNEELISHNKKYSNIKLTSETKCIGLVIGKL